MRPFGNDLIQVSAALRLAQMVGGVVKQRHVAREFHLFGDVALLFGGQARVAARQDFAPVGDKPLELRGALVVEAHHELIGERWSLAL